MAIIASSVLAEGSASTVFVSGSGEAIKSTKHFMHTLSDKLYVIPGQLGQASKAQLVYQLLLGLHIATAAEAMALAARAGLNTKATFDIISNAAGSSSAFKTRVPQMLAGSWTPQLSLEFTLHQMVGLLPSPHAAFALLTIWKSRKWLSRRLEVCTSRCP